MSLVAGESSTSEPVGIKGVSDLSQGKYFQMLRDVRGEGSGDAQDSARLEQISDIVAALRVGAPEPHAVTEPHAVPEPHEVPESDDILQPYIVPLTDDAPHEIEAGPRIGGMADFRASVEALNASNEARKARARNQSILDPDRNWPDSTLASINSMMDSMNMSGGGELPEFLSAQDGRTGRPRGPALRIAAMLAGLALLGAAGYGFYMLGLKDASSRHTREIAEIAALETGRIALDEAGADARKNPNKDQSRLQKEDLITPRLVTPEPLEAAKPAVAGEPATVAAETVKPSNQPATPDKAALPAAPEAAPKAAGLGLVAAQPGVPSSAGKPAGNTVNEASPPPLAKTEPATPAEALETKTTAVNDAAKPAAPAPGTEPAAPQKGAEGKPAPAQPDTAAPLDALVTSVAEGVAALGKPHAGDGTDPARELRNRMTRLAASASAQGIAMSDVKLLLESALAGLKPDEVPEVLRNSAGKVDVSALLSSITAAGKKQL